MSAWASTVAPTLTQTEARELTDQIVSGLRKIVPLVKRAFEGRADRVLGYPNWHAYCAAELGGMTLPLADRPAAVAELREAGMSTRAIGSALHTSEATVRRELRHGDAVEPAKVISLDGRQRPATQPKPKCTECGGPVDEASIQLGYTRCDNCDVVPQLWMSVRRKGLNHHLIPAGSDKTVCDRWVGVDGKGRFDNGILVSAEAVAALESKRCPQCWPETATMPAGQAAGDRIVESIEQKRAIAAARSAARTVAADLLEDVNAIVAGSRAGAADVITPALVAALRQAVDVLEAEMLGREALGGGR